MATDLGILPILAIGVAAIVLGSGAADTVTNGDTDGIGPGNSVIAGGVVVSRGFKSNAYGAKVTFQIEKVSGAEGDEFFGVIFEPWASNSPAVVAQADSRSSARDKTIAHISADEHGAPG